jgi:hypothetical protein
VFKFIRQYHVFTWTLLDLTLCISMSREISILPYRRLNSQECEEEVWYEEIIWFGVNFFEIHQTFSVCYIFWFIQYACKVIISTLTHNLQWKGILEEAHSFTSATITLHDQTFSCLHSEMNSHPTKLDCEHD